MVIYTRLWWGTHLDAKVPSINVVTQKQIPGLGGITADFEQFHQVVILAVNIAAYCNGGVHFQ